MGRDIRRRVTIRWADKKITTTWIAFLCNYLENSLVVCVTSNAKTDGEGKQKLRQAEDY